MKALILDNKVVQVEEQEFPVSEPLTWLDCPSDAELGWQVVDGVVTQPSTPAPPTLSQVKQTKLSELSSFRYQKEVGGFSFGGQTVATDDRSKTLLLGARAIAEKALSTNSPFSMDYKSDGGFISLSATDIIGLSDAVGLYVQALFSIEKTHSHNITSLTTIAEVNEYDFTEGWPA